jgi:hypothetical protein
MQYISVVTHLEKYYHISHLLTHTHDTGAQVMKSTTYSEALTHLPASALDWLILPTWIAAATGSATPVTSSSSICPPSSASVEPELSEDSSLLEDLELYSEPVINTAYQFIGPADCELKIYLTTDLRDDKVLVVSELADRHIVHSAPDTGCAVKMRDSASYIYVTYPACGFVRYSTVDAGDRLNCLFRRCANIK